MIAPLPCPFCGKAPWVGPDDPENDGDAWGIVECVNSRCAVKPRVRDGVSVSDDRGSGAYKAAAIRRWNRRRQ